MRPSSRLGSSPTQVTRRARPSWSTLRSASVRCWLTHSATLRPGLVSTSAPPTRVTDSSSDLGTLPPRHSRMSSVDGNGSTRYSTSGKTSSARSRFSDTRPSTTRNSVRNGGVWAASTRASSGSDPSSAAAPTSISSTTSERSSSPTRSSISRRTASRSTTSSSPRRSVIGMVLMSFHPCGRRGRRP